MDVGSDTFPRDEVTGLAAFDHLDPVSTVSTLNMVPEVPAPAPKIFTPPPPPPMRASVTVPPPAARVSRTFSRPPEAPVGARASLPPAPAVPAELRADTTEVIDIPMSSTGGSFESWEDGDEAATRVVMANGSPAPSTALHMDWDEEEPPTQMRGEGGVSQPKPMVDVDWGDESLETHAQAPAALGYTPAPASGRPSPFPSSRPSAPVMQTPSVRPGAPSPFVSSQVDTAWGQDIQSDRRPLWLIGAGAVAIVALAFIARALLADPTPGLVTLATTPSDARVVINGQPVAGTSSPYSATDIKPGVVHELVVRKPGYAEYRTLFTLQEGEAKTLPAVTLEAEPGETVAMAAAPVAAAAAVVAPAQAAAVAPAQPAEPTKAEVSDRPTRSSKATRVSRRAQRRAAAAARAEARAEARAQARSQKASKRPAAPKVAAASGNGVLRINSRPWAQVFVDGKMIGNTPQMGIQLSAGKHTVKLVNPDMGLQKTLTVTVNNGQTVTKVMNLIE